MNPITSMLLFTIIVITTAATLIALLTITTITCSTGEILQRVRTCVVSSELEKSFAFCGDVGCQGMSKRMI